MWFTECTHLLHVRDDISHLQSKLIILLFLIGKQNHCFCEDMCVEEERKKGEREGRDKRGERKGGGREGGREGGGKERRGRKELDGYMVLQLAPYYACSTITIWEHFIDAYCIPCNI